MAGDVIYGASSARSVYMQKIDSDLMKACGDNGFWLTCDDFNDRTFLYRSSPLETLQDLKFNTQLNDADTHISLLQLPKLRAYYASLSASSRAPSKAVTMPLAEVMAKGNPDKAQLAIRRACKFALEYFLMERKVQVHFVLDLPTRYGAGPFQDDRDVVNKVRHADRVPVTTSELRCCYRNKDQWNPTGRLKFYKNFLEVEPPWVSNPTVWARYGWARYVKHSPILSTVSRWFM